MKYKNTFFFYKKQQKKFFGHKNEKFLCYLGKKCYFAV